MSSIIKKLSQLEDKWIYKMHLENKDMADEINEIYKYYIFNNEEGLTLVARRCIGVLNVIETKDETYPFECLAYISREEGGLLDNGNVSIKFYLEKLWKY